MKTSRIIVNCTNYMLSNITSHSKPELTVRQSARRASLRMRQNTSYSSYATVPAHFYPRARIILYNDLLNLPAIRLRWPQFTIAALPHTPLVGLMWLSSDWLWLTGRVPAMVSDNVCCNAVLVKFRQSLVTNSLSLRALKPVYVKLRVLNFRMVYYH